MHEKSVLITIFGGTGDLAKRKLYPALFRLFKKGHLNEHFAVIGTARREWSDDYYRDVVTASVENLADTPEQIQSFVSHFYYQSHNVQEVLEYDVLKQLATSLEERYQLQGNRIFYLAMAPQFFGLIAENLKAQNLLSENGFNRLIIEKPFGHNLETAIELNQQLSQTFKENQIYRIDHYLGKEMVQNITALRYSNVIFEALWNNHYIDNVQITLAEEVGVEERAGYYDKSGALRDMVQNHIFQILSLLAMEPPAQMNGTEIRREKVKVLRSIRQYDEQELKDNFIRAQYTKNATQKGYLEEPDIDPNSRTETYVAGKLMIDNFRWAGVPFYIRTGKRLACKDTVIHVQFKPTAMNLFKENDAHAVQSNLLTINVQPQQAMSLRINMKTAGLSNIITHEQLLNAVSKEEASRIPEAYERLILACLEGDTMHFSHREEVELSWAFIDKIRSAWDNDTTSTLPTYASKTMGPIESDQLLERDGFYWHDTCCRIPE